jgi:type I restriction enzyme S subunit
MKEGNLPNGWIGTLLGEVIHFTNGFAFKSKEYQEEGTGVGIVRMSNLDNGKVSTVNMKWVPLHYVSELPTELQVQPGDLLIGMSGSIGQPAFNDCHQVFLLNQRVGKISPVLVSKKFIAFFMKTVEKHFLNISMGTAIKNLSTKQIKETELPLPPLNEQKRIVDKIEVLQGHSSRAREALEAVGPLLEKFRQSVLASAFRGDLTKEWREQNPDVEPAEMLLARIKEERRTRWIEAVAEKGRARAEAKALKANKVWTTDDDEKVLVKERAKAEKKYTEPEPPDVSELPELPKGWCWMRLGQVLQVQTGYAFKSRIFLAEGVPLIRIGNLKKGLVSISEKTVFLDESQLDEYQQYRLKQGDVLMALSGATTGKMATYTLNQPALLNQRVGRFVLFTEKNVSNEFVPLLVDSISHNILEQAWGGAQPNISPSAIENNIVAIPPLDEQYALINRYKTTISIRRNILEQRNTVLQGLNNLNQSILAKAFRGELVPQDPNDEPASVLLERIKAEREATAPKKKKSRKKKKTTTG